MKFAFTFAKQIFHSEAISHGEAIFHSPKANFVEKSQVDFRLDFFLVEMRGIEPLSENLFL